MIGKTIGHYHILERLGQAETSVVYKARDLKLDRLVSVKAIDFSKDDSDGLTSFQKEARAGMVLNHPHIASIYDVIEEKDGRYLIYEYLPGGTLRSRMERAAASGEPIPLEDSIDYILDVAEGLAEAHRHGIIHRNVNCENVIVTPTHVVKITNFGQARIRESGQTFAPGGRVLGTLGYVSPEQLQGLEVDRRSDIYSVCSVLFELVTGERPFRATGAAEMLHEIIYSPVPPMSEIRPGVPDRLQEIVAKGMAKDPAERYQNMEALIADLRALQRAGVREAEPLPEEPAIGVLPIADLSADKGLDSFCDGLAEEIVHGLRTVEGLRVASRTSAARFKGKAEDVRKVAAQLNVNQVLEGSVRSSGNRARITLQLTDASTGYQMWSERFDRELGDTFALQDEIAQAVVKALRLRMLGDAGLPVLNLADVQTAVRGLAAPQPILPDAASAAHTTLRLDSESVDAHVALGYARAICDQSPKDAEASFRRALELKPGCPEALAGLATCVLAPLGRFEEAEASLARADLSALPVSLALGMILFWQQRYDAAIEQCRQSYRIDPNSPDLYLILGRAYAARGQYSEALTAIERGRRFAQEDPRLLAALGYCYAKSGRSEEAERISEEIGRLAKDRYVSALDIALVYAGLGLNEWVECCETRAREERAVGLLWWDLDPEWIAVRQQMGKSAGAR